MSVAVIADAHIGGPGGPPGKLTEQLQELARGECRHLVLLGDLFHVWIGDRRFETAEIQQVLETLRGLRRLDFRIDYVEGNRDFFIADSPYAELFDLVDREISFETGGRRYLAVHGDGLNASDRQYLFWRWLSKSRLSRFFLFHLPRWLAASLMYGTERQLAKTNFKHKVRIPEDAILSYAGGRLEGDFDVMLLGHFHEPRRWRVANGEVRLLDAWFRSRRIEWLGGEGE